MSLVGKLHEISLYGLITTIVLLVKKKISIALLWEAAFRPDSISMFFVSFLFWASVLFVPIAIVGALVTKYRDDGAGMTFYSDFIIVIIFAHIAEEFLGLILTPFWLIRDVIAKNLDGWKIVDYATYFVEIIFIAMGIILI